ncbi:MAG: hypothetical protein KH452_04660 [Clostridiales bacterium]|nr:hypothetical protein [Clostridiales bacterium]
MKKWLKNIMAVAFLISFLPYTVTLLMNGREGIHQEERLSELEYRVLYELLKEDYSWMADGTLELMAILYRTECVRTQTDEELQEISESLYADSYERLYQAVERTRGQVITIGGEYRELPYHGISAGVTRNGTLLGEEFSYVNAVECPRDRESGSWLQRCRLTEEELEKALGKGVSAEGFTLERDSADYVTRVTCMDRTWQGENIRSLLHLNSSCFWLEPEEGAVWITVKGSGHGFGISLYTADCMIQEGAGITEIIQKFYQDAECITIP